MSQTPDKPKAPPEDKETKKLISTEVIAPKNQTNTPSEVVQDTPQTS